MPDPRVFVRLHGRMALSRSAPPRAAALVSAAFACGTALAGAGLPASAATAAPARAAASTLITLTVTGVPALGTDSFQGSYATSTVAQNGGDNSADTADPTGVLDRITVNQPAPSKTHSDPARNWADAQPAVEYALHGKKLYSISSVDAHAECTPSSSAPTTYVHTTADSVNVLGKSIPAGKTTVPVTGAQLGAAGVDHGSLTVSYTTAATQEKQTSSVSAHAHMDLDISGVFYDSAGKQLYSGPVQKLRLGDVQVACQSTGATPSTSASSAASSTPMPAPGSPSAIAGSPQAAVRGMPSAEEDTTNPAGAAHPHNTHHEADPRKSTRVETTPAAPQNGPMVPAANTAKTASSGGGDTSAWWALLSVVALGSGAGLYIATRKRGRHQ